MQVKKIKSSFPLINKALPKGFLPGYMYTYIPYTTTATLYDQSMNAIYNKSNIGLDTVDYYKILWSESVLMAKSGLKVLFIIPSIELSPENIINELITKYNLKNNSNKLDFKKTSKAYSTINNIIVPTDIKHSDDVSIEEKIIKYKPDVICITGDFLISKAYVRGFRDIISKYKLIGLLSTPYKMTIIGYSSDFMSTHDINSNEVKIIKNRFGPCYE